MVAVDEKDREKRDLIKIGSVNIVRTMVELCVSKNVSISFAKIFLYSNIISTTQTHEMCLLNAVCFPEYPQVQRIICYSLLILVWALFFHSFRLFSCYFGRLVENARTYFMLPQSCLVLSLFHPRLILFIFSIGVFASVFVISFCKYVPAGCVQISHVKIMRRAVREFIISAASVRVFFFLSISI